MKQLTYILLVIVAVQLLLTVCAVEGKKHRSDKSHRSERGRAAKKTAAKKKGGGKLESEEFCTKGDQCESGNCCPIPLEPKQKACYKEDCSAAKTGPGKYANPPIHEWDTSDKYYKLFIRDYSDVLDAAQKCCEWKTNGRLALVNTDPVYDNVYKNLIEGMKTKQDANKADTSIEATVRIDGTDIDQEGNFVWAFADTSTPIDKKFWYEYRKEPMASPDFNCVGIRYYSRDPGNYKFVALHCHTTLPFLCEASKSGNKDASKKKGSDAGKKKAPDAGKKKKGK